MTESFFVLVKVSIYLNILIRSMADFTCSGGLPVLGWSLIRIDAAISERFCRRDVYKATTSLPYSFVSLLIQLIRSFNCSLVNPNTSKVISTEFFSQIYPIVKLIFEINLAR
jgi:hypothetical protein